MLTWKGRNSVDNFKYILLNKIFVFDPNAPIDNKQTVVQIMPWCRTWTGEIHCYYDDVIMGAMASQITSLTIVYSTVYSDADQRKHQSSASLAFVRGIHRGPMNSPRKWPVVRKMSPFDDVIMIRILSINVFRWYFHFNLHYKFMFLTCIWFMWVGGLIYSYNHRGSRSQLFGIYLLSHWQVHGISVQLRGPLLLTWIDFNTSMEK